MIKMVKVPKYQIEKMLKAKGIDPATIDYSALWDSSLSRSEGFDLLRKKIKIFETKPKEPEIQKGQYSTRMLKKTKRQTGKSDRRRDKKRKALPCGLRETWYGNVYYENRKNRCDKNGGL